MRRTVDTILAVFVIAAGVWLGLRLNAWTVDQWPDDPQATCEVERINATTSRTTCE